MRGEKSLEVREMCADAEILTVALVNGVARWEWLTKGRTGEVCFNGLRYACDVRRNGIPRLGLTQEILREAIKRHGINPVHQAAR